MLALAAVISDPGVIDFQITVGKRWRRPSRVEGRRSQSSRDTGFCFS